MKFKSILNYEPFKGEKNNQPSLTVPDQTMSLREILARYTRGLPIGGSLEPIYHGEDEYIPDPRTMDLVDRQEFAEQLNERVEKVKAEAAAKAAEKAAEAAAKQADKVGAVE